MSSPPIHPALMSCAWALSVIALGAALGLVMGATEPVPPATTTKEATPMQAGGNAPTDGPGTRPACPASTTAASISTTAKEVAVSTTRENAAAHWYADGAEPNLTGAYFATTQAEDIAAYIGEVNPRADGRGVADLLTRAGDGFSIDPWLLASIARYESGFVPGCIGPRYFDGTGVHRCYGLLQISDCHRRKMAGMGLDFTTETDRLWYGCWMIRSSLDNGAELYSALRPWTTRRRAWRELTRLQKEGRTTGPQSTQSPTQSTGGSDE